MSNYIRPKVPGATVFCTVVLAQRGSSLLVDHIDLLQAAVAETKSTRPFQTEAWVVLPDHMHFVWTLPEGDCDLGVRVGATKARFTMKLRRAGFSPPSTLPVVLNGRYAGLKPGLRRWFRRVGFTPPLREGRGRGWWVGNPPYRLLNRRRNEPI